VKKDANEITKEINRDLIRYAIRQYPCRNIKQLTTILSANRKRWLPELRQHYPEARDIDLPLGAMSRDTIRNHIRALQSAGEIVQIGRGFITLREYFKGTANALNARAKALLRAEEYHNRNFPYAGDAAGCYMFFDPPTSHEQIQDVLTLQTNRFGESLFWFDDMITHALLVRAISKQVYSVKAGRLNSKLLSEGLSKWFRGSKLFALAIVVSPPQLINFLTTSPGLEWASQRLQKNWPAIMKAADNERRKLERT
jgi:DNA-binding transcriptional ArsR family regulator